MAKPVPATIEAIAVLALVHDPPGEASDNEEDAPTHKLVEPLMGAGCEFTRNGVVIRHPVDATVNVMVVIPATTPVTTPEPMPTVATEGLLLVHDPEPPASLNADVFPAQALVVPVIAGGYGLTVTGAAIVQPVDAV